MPINDNLGPRQQGNKLDHQERRNSGRVLYQDKLHLRKYDEEEVKEVEDLKRKLQGGHEEERKPPNEIQGREVVYLDKRVGLEGDWEISAGKSHQGHLETMVSEGQRVKLHARGPANISQDQNGNMGTYAVGEKTNKKQKQGWFEN